MCHVPVRPCTNGALCKGSIAHEIFVHVDSCMDSCTCEMCKRRSRRGDKTRKWRQVRATSRAPTLSKGIYMPIRAESQILPHQAMSLVAFAPEMNTGLSTTVPLPETTLPPVSRIVAPGPGSSTFPPFSHATVIHKHSTLFNTSSKSRQPQPEKEWVSRGPARGHGGDREQSKPSSKVRVSLFPGRKCAASRKSTMHKTRAAPLIPKKKHGKSIRWAYHDFHPDFERYQYHCPSIGAACDWMFDHTADLEQHVQEHQTCREYTAGALSNEIRRMQCGHPTFSCEADMRKHIRALHPLEYDGEMDPHARYQPPPSMFV